MNDEPNEVKCEVFSLNLKCNTNLALILNSVLILRNKNSKFIKVPVRAWKVIDFLIGKQFSHVVFLDVKVVPFNVPVFEVPFFVGMPVKLLGYGSHQVILGP